ncbi:MAG: nucleotidyltransferase family protein [Polyangiales bacterium]
MNVTHAMVLCAGLGTRLRPLTDERPKPLVPVRDRPLAAWAMERLAGAGARHLVANAHHLAEQIEPALAPWASRLGASLTVLREAELLGTGGGILNALPALGDDFFVFNGDVLAAPDLAAAAAAHRATDAWMTLVLRHDPRAERLGAIEVDGEGRVRRILGEGAAPDAPVRACLFTGVYVVSRRVADDLPRAGCVVRHTLRRLLARGERVSAVVDDGAWHDLGTPESYARAQFSMLRGELQGFEASPDAQYRGPDVSIEAGVDVAGPTVLGTGARVRGKGRIQRVIAWPGAEVVAPCSDQIVTPRSVVHLPTPGEGA